MIKLRTYEEIVQIYAKHTGREIEKLWFSPHFIMVMFTDNTEEVFTLEQHIEIIK